MMRNTQKIKKLRKKICQMVANAVNRSKAREVG